MQTCNICGIEMSGIDASEFLESLGGNQGIICNTCKFSSQDHQQIDISKEAFYEQLTRHAHPEERIESIIITSTQSIDGYYIAEYLGFESIEFVIGTGIISEFVTNFQDSFGMRSGMFENKLSQAKKWAMKELRILAVTKGANAIVAVDLDYTEFSQNRVALILSGTLVKVVPYEST